MGFHDWFEFARLGGGTHLWIGPGLGEGRQTLRTWSLLMKLLRDAAAEGNGQFGAYIHNTLTPLERAYELTLKTMTLFANGGSACNYWVYGPHYAFTEWTWSEKLAHYGPIADAHRLIGRSEGLVMSGQPPKALVALLWPVTTQFWELNKDGMWNHNRDYLVEMLHVYLALNHEGIPVRFLDEECVRRGDLRKYRVLYLTGTNLGEETAKRIRRWVQDGGWLWTCARAGLESEYDEPLAVLNGALGIRSREVEAQEGDYAPRGGLKGMQHLDTVRTGGGEPIPAGEFAAYGSRAALTLAGGRPIGSFGDGSPAVVLNEFGRGRSLHFAAMPGLAYSRSAVEEPGRPTTGYGRFERKLITAWARAAGAVAPVTTSRLSVEAIPRYSEDGIAVVLVNWTNTPAERLAVHVGDAQGFGHVESVRLGKVDVEQRGPGLIVRLPMRAPADVLLLTRGGR